MVAQAGAFIFLYQKANSGAILLAVLFVLSFLLTVKPIFQLLKPLFKHIVKIIIVLFFIFVILAILFFCGMFNPFAFGNRHNDDALDLKPIIYLYPKEMLNVTVNLGNPNKLTHTYPKYNNGWFVTARPNGNLTTPSGRNYYALYWEGIHSKSYNNEEGFLISGTDTISFLEEKLAQLGLTEYEANEFIIYWLPKLEINNYNFIRFQTVREINENMPLAVVPTPDTVIRVMMAYKPLDEKISVKPQQLPPTPERKGFVVVEWGGSEIP